ncbi:hypothetical protein Pint_25148 [Pistacia integerrima]|uniref:Uncharacterized protein n=1 Tax=Pistacia integerrima TaxID=434235 RepID=A0ACC0YED0_9ROSI|nr:hypothetical protein Pint_25148 [Pistacia integerrima]
MLLVDKYIRIRFKPIFEIMKKNNVSCMAKVKDDISCPFSAQFFDFCDPELFSEALQNSEVTSSSNCCYEENSSYTKNPTSLPTDVDKFNNSYQDNTNANTNTTTPATTATSTTTNNTTNNNSSNNLSIIFDSQDEIDNDISASIDFSPSPPFSVNPFFSTELYQFDFSSMQPHQIPMSNVNVDGLSSQYPVEPVAPSLLGPHHQPLPSVFEEDCLSSVPSYVPLNPSSPSCSFLGPAAMTTYMPTGTMSAALSTDSGGIFSGGILRGSDLQLQELDYQGENGGIYCPDSLQRVFNPGDLQALSGDSQQRVGGASSSTAVASELSSLEDSTFKVGKLSVEQRKEKIHSRPRVRGRFAKNDDFGETHRTSCSNPEEEDENEVRVIKVEDDMNDSSSDILGHITGVNSFKFNNYSIQSWI